MNSSHITTNPRGHPTEFEQIIQEKSHNFVGREFVFTAINNFLHRHNQGYFTIIGAPGSGKSAILAKYVTNNPQVIYYNAELEGKNRADEFLKVVYTQLIDWLHNLNTPPQPSPQARREQDFSQLGGVPDNATEESWFLSLLLQQIILTAKPIASEAHYSLYHSSFRDGLGKQQIKPSEKYPRT
ncbi:hypothetical protein [Nostoc sp. ChiQUE01b]|uniref:hypothetical protein n=1 Tax=Nostoc sp. ChiQUE01b TaxID=3075376 RepID=UPI002AD39669|nr:hypothetical protein [Nostoc sp. ChiQUE01b]MDZ8262512.1 hypothetical protein [Nostoc sp. ChiQUE01b]